MNTNYLDELLGSELAGKLTSALGLSDKGEAEAVLRQVKSLETELLMDVLHSAPSGSTVAKVFRRALIDALVKHVTEKNELEDQIDKLEDRVDTLAGELSEAHEDARYALVARDRLSFEVASLRTEATDIVPYRELVSKLAIYITATPGTLDAFDPGLVERVDVWREHGEKIEAIKAVRQALLCGLKEAKDLVEARMAMHEADRVASLEASGVAVEKLVPVGSVQPNFVLTKVLDDGSEVRLPIHDADQLSAAGPGPKGYGVELLLHKSDDDGPVPQAEKDEAFEKMNRSGPTTLCTVCGRFMPIDDKGKLLSHDNLFTGIECEGTEARSEAKGPTLADLGIEHLVIRPDSNTPQA